MNNFQLFLLSLKKEGRFILRDRRSILTSVLIGLLLTPIMFGLLNLIEESQIQSLDDEVVTISTSNGIDLQNDPLVESLNSIDSIEVIEVDSVQDSLREGDIFGYLEAETTDAGQTVYSYIYDSTSNLSSLSINRVTEYFSQFAQLERFERLAELNLRSEDIDKYGFNTVSLQSILDLNEPSNLVLFFLPYIILVGLITGAQQYAVEITTGEKERKTLATTLSLDIPLNIIAASKTTVVIIVSLVSVVINVASIFIASEVFNMQEEFGLTIGLSQLGYLVLILLPLATLISSIIVILGLFARNQKEAGLYLSPLLIASILFGFTSNAFDANSEGPVFLVPLLGHVGAIKQILLNEINILNISMVVGSSVVFAVIATLVSVRLFKSEKILFRQ